MTANYMALLADPLATKAWLCTLWPYDVAHVAPSLVGDGVASYGAATVAAPAGSMSWGCWVKPRTSAIAAKYIAGFGGDGAAAGQRFLRLSSSGTNLAEAVVSNDAGTQFLATWAGMIVSVPPGMWTYLYAVLDVDSYPATLSLYSLTMAPPVERLPGYLALLRRQATVSGTFNAPGNACSVLRDPVGANQYLDGEVSDFQVYAGALNSTQVQPWYWSHGLPYYNPGLGANLMIDDSSFLQIDGGGDVLDLG